MSKICIRCKVRPMAYPDSNNHWCKECLAETRKAHYNADKIRDRNLRQNYRGFTSSDYDALFTKQGGVCASCNKRQKQPLHVDHDHKTGMVRGLLCSGCNTALGHLQDSPVIIQSLLHYVLQHSEQAKN